jgi:hypothetical protein
MKIAVEVPNDEAKTLLSLTKADSYRDAVKTAVETFLRKNGFSMQAPKEVFDAVPVVVKETIEKLLPQLVRSAVKETVKNTTGIDKGELNKTVGMIVGRTKASIVKTLNSMEKRIDALEKKTKELEERIKDVQTGNTAEVERKLEELKKELEELKRKGISVNNEKAPQPIWEESSMSNLEPCTDVEIIQWTAKINSTFFKDMPFGLKVIGKNGDSAVVKATANVSFPVMVAFPESFMDGLYRLASDGRASVSMPLGIGHTFFVRKVEEE